MNPLDHDGTYVLPAAQMDRFTVQVSMGFPPAEAEMRMLDAHLGNRPPVDDLQPVIDVETFLGWQETVPLIFVSDVMKRYVVDLVNSIRADARALAPPSPRATLMLVRVAQARAMASGRDHLLPEDVQDTAPDVLSHRMLLAGDATAHGYVRDMMSKIDVHG